MENGLALNKMMAYCAYQERCRLEILQKLKAMEVPEAQQEDIVKYLEEEGYLNEQRFARAFAEGKFRIKNWGRLKIRAELKARRISDVLIKDAVSLVCQEDYYKVLKVLIRKKISTEKRIPEEKLKFKILRYAYSKGFEADLASDALNEVLAEEKKF
jgi:regulatory protein